MKTPKEFDYDLWIDRNDGQCYVRVKNTGEVSAVNADTFRFLRREEKGFVVKLLPISREKHLR